MKIKTLTPSFVAHLPDQLAEGVLYVCEEFAMAAHKCCCGCGEEVITPLNPAQWRLTRKGNLVSLFPSIGNWKYRCRSHYWIKNNQVLDAGPMTNRVIEQVKQKDRRDKDRYIATLNQTDASAQPPKLPITPPYNAKAGKSWLDTVFDWLAKVFGK